MDVPVPVDFFSCFLTDDSDSNDNLWLVIAILIQPLFSGEERTAAELELANVCSSVTLAGADYCWREFLPKGATRNHVAAWVRRRDIGSFPPLAMVVIGGFDPLKDRHVNYVELLPLLTLANSLGT
ncbi:hypothetical protein EJB05_51606, partial [Eragrostis curvula]